LDAGFLNQTSARLGDDGAKIAHTLSRQCRRRQQTEIGNTPTPTLRDAQAPGQDVSQAEPEATLPRHRASRDMTTPKANHSDAVPA